MKRETRSAESESGRRKRRGRLLSISLCPIGSFSLAFPPHDIHPKCISGYIIDHSNAAMRKRETRGISTSGRTRRNKNSAAGNRGKKRRLLRRLNRLRHLSRSILRPRPSLYHTCSSGAKIKSDLMHCD